MVARRAGAGGAGRHPVTGGGFVDPRALETLAGAGVLLVSVMAANSETGVLNPVAEIAERVHAAGALFHCDATQAAAECRSTSRRPARTSYR